MLSPQPHLGSPPVWPCWRLSRTTWCLAGPHLLIAEELISEDILWATELWRETVLENGMKWTSRLWPQPPTRSTLEPHTAVDSCNFLFLLFTHETKSSCMISFEELLRILQMYISLPLLFAFVSRRLRTWRKMFSTSSKWEQWTWRVWVYLLLPAQLWSAKSGPSLFQVWDIISSASRYERHHLSCSVITVIQLVETVLQRELENLHFLQKCWCECIKLNLLA